MAHPTAVQPEPTTIVVQEGTCFAVGGHSCTTWRWAWAAYQCDHGFVMWKSQVRDAYRPPAAQQGES